MEILLLGIYSFFVWLIFFKYKWLPWNMVSQVIVITLPIIGITALILLANIRAPPPPAPSATFPPPLPRRRAPPQLPPRGQRPRAGTGHRSADRPKPAGP